MITWGFIVVNCQVVILIVFHGISLKPLHLPWICLLCFTSISTFLFCLFSTCLRVKNYNFVYILITCRVSHAFSWKFLKPHMFAIVQDVLFPILSYSQADEELWNTDPYEYIRVKFGKNISYVHYLLNHTHTHTQDYQKRISILMK